MLKNHKNNLYLIWFGLAFIVAAIAMFLFYKDINLKLVTTEVDNIELTANQQQSTINGVIARHAANLVSMSNTLMIIGKNEAALAEYLSNLENNLGIDTVIYVNPDGYGRLSSLKTVDVFSNEAFQGAMQGELTVSAPYQSHLKNPNFVQDISAICNKYGDIRHFIEVELTETAVTENAANLAKLLDDLHEAGFTVAIDDFGAGYSSLGMLKDFKVDVLKLDQSFFDNKSPDTRGNIVVNGISDIAHRLGMVIVAEGIEISEQIKPIEANCLELAQGFFFAHPMPMEEFEQKYLD